MIKILFEGLSNNLGGIETFIYNLIKNADKNKFEFSILLDENIVTPYQDEYQDNGIKIYRVTSRKKNYFKYLKELKKIYQDNQFDYIHINVMSYSLFERITYACKYSKAKVIVHSHNAGYKNGYYRTRILHQIGKLIVKPHRFLKIACGEEAGKFMFKPNEYKIFNNGIDLEKFQFSQKYRKEIREELNLQENTIAIGLVAAFLPVKNHIFLIDIFNEILKLNNNSKLILIGTGPTQEKIKQEVKKINLQNKILFLGKRMDVNKIYSGLDIYLMPSISEGLSISLVEAQVNGLKCYTSTGVDKNSNVTGNVDFISLKNTSKEWADRIINSNNNRDINALDKVPDEFNAKKSYEKLFNYYKENQK